jgi:hypothetical protein
MNTQTIYRLATMTADECRELVRERRGTPIDDKYQHAWDYFENAYREAVMRNLRINRRTWVMRDNGIGVLSQPVKLADWPECTPNDARDELAWKIWCNAVRMYNVLQ